MYVFDVVRCFAWFVAGGFCYSERFNAAYEDDCEKHTSRNKHKEPFEWLPEGYTLVAKQSIKFG